MKYHFVFSKDEYGGHADTKVFLYDYVDNQKYYLTIKDGLFERHPIGEYEAALEPLFKFTEHMEINLLDAMVEGLARIGYVAEVDNKKRIVAEALAEERKVQNEYLKSVHNQLIHKIVDKI